MKLSVKVSHVIFMKNLIFVVFALTFIGCATAPPIVPSKPKEGMPGIYHRVEKGQTLWKISKLYNISIDELTKINRIADATKIEIGQLIFIPNRQKQVLPDASGEDFIWPLKGKVIAGYKQTASGMINKGIDIQPYRAGDNVIASRSGRIVFYSPDFKESKKTIIIDHGDGFLSVYASNSEVFVKIGDVTARGTPIAKAGAYLHFEIRRGHIPQNPFFYLPPHY